MYPDKKMDELMDRLKRKIEAFVLTTSIIIIAICLVYLYIIRPSKSTTPTKIAYEKFKTFSMPIGDVTGTEDYEDETIATYTDDWGIRYDVKQRIK
jgi:hypothetical protein